MKKVGIITSDREFSYYLSLFNNQPIQLINIKCETDFQIIEKLIICHQPLSLLENRIEFLGIKEVLSNWLKENGLLTFGFATIYVIHQFKQFPIELTTYKLNVLENNEVYIYPKLDPYTVVCFPNLNIKELCKDVEVISKWKETIVGVRFGKSIGYFFIPTKETEELLLLEFIE